MKKRSFGLIIVFVLLISIFIYLNNKNKYLSTDDIIGVYVNNELNGEIPSKGSAMFQKAVCDDENTKVTWDNDKWGVLISNINKKAKCNLYFYSGQTVFDFDYTGGEQTFIAPVSGTYKVELWGASGGGYYFNDKDFHGGNGAYVSGLIKLSKYKNLYAYVGQQSGVVSGMCYGSNKNNNFNVSIIGGCAVGGGATDVRLVKGNTWYDFNSLKSRILVSAGGGGGIYEGSAGSGGGLIGYDGVGTADDSLYNIGLGATQTKLKFGYNADGATTIGGGGYYVGNNGDASNSGGGSSFISGHNGCDAIKEESTADNIIHTGQSIHYSGLYFTDTVMIDGEGYKWTDKKEEYVGMPSHSDNSIITGNTGNGYARITLISIDE